MKCQSNWFILCFMEVSAIREKIGAIGIDRNELGCKAESNCITPGKLLRF